jgi:hypothetical protein
MGAAPSLASSTQDSVENWLADYNSPESNRYADTLKDYDRVVERLLAGESDGHTSSAPFGPQDLAAIAAAGRASRLASDAGILGSPAATAEQALLELAATGSASLPLHVRVLERRLLALRALHTQYAASSPALPASSNAPSSLHSTGLARRGGLEASKNSEMSTSEDGQDGIEFESPAEYIATHQVYFSPLKNSV